MSLDLGGLGAEDKASWDDIAIAEVSQAGRLEGATLEDAILVGQEKGVDVRLALDIDQPVRNQLHRLDPNQPRNL